ncbi:MAG: hypothetical protein QGG42_12715 [Phycisphaerae bacterium]|jgi:hypothetical protein|nr:hypothetical protein [Phycisphaerae bacterium]
MNAIGKQIVIWAVLVCVASGAWGQIVLVQDGRALDSNSRIGGGRVNTRAPQRTSFSSQMYITGQVSGLGAFRGVTGYTAANELRMTVPSSALSDFRRQSVGLADVLRGETYRTGAYLDRSKTALGLRGIRAGLADPGTNVPRTGHLGTIVPSKTLDEAMADFRPLLRDRAGGAISAEIQPAIKLDAAPVRVIGRRGPSTVRPDTTIFGAAELAVFTVSRPSQRNEVDVELRELELVESDDLSRVDSKVRGPVIVPPAAGDGSATHAALGGVGIASRAARESDLFLTMVYLLQKQHLAATGQTPVKGSGDNTENTDLNLKPLGPRPNSVELVEQGLRGELVFNTLAGKGSDAFNVAMRAGEKQLKQARFYSAADQYRLAAEIQPDNPTARLGLSVSLFGAGEALGAALQLRRAMEMFPPVMVTRLKVIRTIPSEKLKSRLDQLYKRLEGRKGENVNPQLAMLAAYMHRSSGENYIAELCAVKLKGAAGDDKLYAAFAAYVLTGKRPAAVKTPTTKPASDK